MTLKLRIILTILIFLNFLRGPFKHVNIYTRCLFYFLTIYRYYLDEDNIAHDSIDWFLSVTISID